MAQGVFVSYLRVSTDRQGRSCLGLEAQREAAAQYLNGGSWRLALRLSRSRAASATVVTFAMTGHLQGVIMKSPEDYRAMAAESCAKPNPCQGLRLNHIVVAQLWLELADKVTQLRLESRP